MEQPASEHLLKFGIDETTLRIVLHRFMSAGFMSDKENKQVLVSDLKDFATLLHTPGLDDAARRNALEAMLPQTELRPVNVLKLNNALNELIDRPKADKDELLGRVEDLLKSIQQLLKSC